MMYFSLNSQPKERNETTEAKMFDMFTQTGFQKIPKMFCT